VLANQLNNSWWAGLHLQPQHQVAGSQPSPWERPHSYDKDFIEILQLHVAMVMALSAIQEPRSYWAYIETSSIAISVVPQVLELSILLLL